MRKAVVNGNTINFEKIVVKSKSVEDFINELEPNVTNIISYAKRENKKPFQGKSHKLKEWLIQNQEGYNKYIPDVYHYFKKKCAI